MEPPLPENSSFDRQTVIRELAQGHEFATRLLILLQKPSGNYGSVESQENLAGNIFRSFSEALSLLESDENRDVFGDPATTRVSSPCSVSGKTKNSGETRKSPTWKDQEVEFKRRKSSQTWIKMSAMPLNDGHRWRKYGQKEILGAKFPRNYFRCTHRNDQGCMATKQVQHTEEEEPMYRIAYFGHHTCRDLLKVSPFLMDSTSRETCFLSFESHPMKKKQGHPSIASLALLKRENKEEMFNDLTIDNLLPSSSGCFWPSDLMPSAQQHFPVGASASDPGDVISDVCSPSSSYSVDMDVGIDDLITFDEGYF